MFSLKNIFQYKTFYIKINRALNKDKKKNYEELIIFVNIFVLKTTQNKKYFKNKLK